MHNAGMTSDTVQQVKDRLSIVDVVSGYVKLQRAGTVMKARCPFHAEKTPSFVVSPDRGTYHCFGCGVGGDIFSFVQESEGLDFKGALKVLAERAGVQLVYEKSENRDDRERLFALLETAALYYVSKLDIDAKNYLKERGVSEETIQSFRLGWAGNGWSDGADYLRTKGYTEHDIIEAGLARKNERGGLLDKFRNRIMFPIADAAGRIIGFSGRTFGPNASPEAPKYLNSPETPLFHKSKVLYGFDKAKQAIRRHDCAVLVEGQMDLLASHQAGWGNAVAVSGTAFTPEHAVLLKRMSDNLVLALDADEAGIKAAGRAARSALSHGLNVKVATLPTGLDPADLIQKEGKEAWSAAIRDAKDIITFLLDVLAERLPQQDRFRRAVESVVLPFVSDVSSPIAREQYLTQIAERLGVSVAAVSTAISNVPLTTETRSAQQAIQPTEQTPKGNDRLRQAFALLIWQASLETPALNLRTLETDLTEAAGEEAIAHLKTLSQQEQEALRFEAEALYAKSTRVDHDAKALVSVILRDRLARELSTATAVLKAAEISGDEEAVARAMAACHLLTARIAKIHGVV